MISTQLSLLILIDMHPFAHVEFHPKLKLLGITAVHGNATLDRTFKNASRVLKACNVKDVKVYAGAEKPLLKHKENATHIHGETGLDGSDLLPDEDYSLMQSGVNGIKAMAEGIMNSPEPVIVAAIGPMTNVALLLSTFPEVKSNIREVLIMGGGIGFGNVTKTAEFNIFADPEGLQVILQAGLDRVVMVPLDCTHKCSYTSEVQQKFTDMATPINPAFTKMINDLTAFVRKSYVNWGLDPEDMHWHDAIAVCHAVRPDAFDDVPMLVKTVCGENDPNNGQTVGDRHISEHKPANCIVSMDMNSEIFWEEMFKVWELAARSSDLKF
ncbi:hypothetical protein AX774_g1590 [Zancudomyces culisetae]|uniref:Inosine/uridine-preferring nucleoside hydrolase domain-containing protein n=1 Tax=Zancudomyces culisetae TaxID=1213189 RepID=A0A1R1PV62_ZANCU|nr:hypothetical protein AX774_g1590 [Zancudomyces culisetae]|eukprot:OMH84857.1 hypothetical protein AX774_g1590 [Zancudomyces culisetae]